MAKVKKSLLGTQFIEAVFIESNLKKRDKDRGQHTKYAATSRNGITKKRYRGQGR